MIKTASEKISDNLNKNRGLLKHIILISFTSVISAILTVLFKMYMARKLGPGAYGELISLIAILFILLTGFSAAHITLAKFFSDFRSKRKYGKMSYLFRTTLRYSFFSGAWA